MFLTLFINILLFMHENMIFNCLFLLNLVTVSGTASGNSSSGAFDFCFKATISCA